MPGLPPLSKQAGDLLVAARGGRERKALGAGASSVDPELWPKGITGEALSHIERGTQNPTLNRLDKIGALYGIRFVLTAIPMEESDG